VLVVGMQHADERSHGDAHVKVQDQTQNVGQRAGVGRSFVGILVQRALQPTDSDSGSCAYPGSRLIGAGFAPPNGSGTQLRPRDKIPRLGERDGRATSSDLGVGGGERDP
jgi:hypothetical protein